MTEVAFTVEFHCRRCGLRRCSGGASHHVPDLSPCECEHVASLPSLSPPTPPLPQFVLRTVTGHTIGGEEGEPIRDMAQAARLAYRIAVVLGLDVVVSDAVTGLVVDRIGPNGRIEVMYDRERAQIAYETADEV
jgi:hypothetical protein